MKKTCAGALLAAFVLANAPFVFACDGGNVREAALNEDRDVHVLCVIAKREDASADETYDRLAEWQIDQGSDLNVTLERIDADDPDVRWEDYGMPSAPPSLPVVALVGRFVAQRRTFVVDHWEPAPNDDELNTLLSSPAREAMKERIVDVWATLLYAPATKQAAEGTTDADLDKILEATSKRWANEQPPGIVVVKFDRNDPKERLLRAFTGIPDEGPAWLGIVYGRGKLMAPPLQGEEITKQNLNRLLESLAVPCTCLADVTVQGIDIPMTWGDELSAQVASMVSTTGYAEFTIGEVTVPGPGGVAVTPEVKERLDKELEEIEAELPSEKAQVVASVLLPLITIATLGLGIVLVAVARKERRGNPVE